MSEDLIVTKTTAQVRELLREVVTEVLAEAQSPQVEGLIGLQELCRRLDCSPATVSRLVRVEGLPTLRLCEGGERRWSWPRVLEWLESRGGAP
jgi:hypothetical protein